MENNQRLTILVNSCDKYSDLWPIFFEVLKKQWKDVPYRIILNTETKAYTFDGLNIECLQLYKDKSEEELKEITWSKRLIDTLKYVDTKYVLFLLEDFYLTKEVNQIEVEKLLDKLDKIKNFACIYLMDLFMNFPTYYDKKTNLYRLPHYFCYKANATAGIWHKKYLQKILREDEDPWQFEINATKRAYLKKGKFYAQAKHEYMDQFKLPKRKVAKVEPQKAFHIDVEAQIIKGKWSTKAIGFLEGLGIKVDWSKRGIMDSEIFFGSHERKQKAINTSYKNWHCENEMIFLVAFFVSFYIKQPIKKLFSKNKK